MDNITNKEKLAVWLNEKWKEGIKCPVCKENDWGLYEQLWELKQFHKGATFNYERPMIPLAIITCNNCGHTMHFNALKIGLTIPDGLISSKKVK